MLLKLEVLNWRRLYCLGETLPKKLESLMSVVISGFRFVILMNPTTETLDMTPYTSSNAETHKDVTFCNLMALISIVAFITNRELFN